MATCQRHRLGLGVEARSRALLSEGETAEESYLEAIERLGRTRCGRIWHARTWSTANGCAGSAAAPTPGSSSALAHDMFEAMGMEAFAERAGRELQATGETARKRTVVERPNS